MSGVTPSGTVKEYLTVEPCSLQAENSVVKESFTTYNHAEIQAMKPYPKYKDSGVEWIGKVPEGWDIWKLAHAYNGIGSGTTPPSSEEKWYGGDIPWVTTGELRENLIIKTKKTVTGDAINNYSTLRLYPINSIAIAMYGATIGRLGMFGIEATTNQACCVLATSEVFINKFVFYWFATFRDKIITLSSGGGQPNINQEKISSLRLATPGKNEQAAIAAFLDRKTAEIDKLIANKERLIELYEEEKKAVINQAVTKGLDPDAEMRESGVEWLGEIPEHWEVKALKYLSKIIDCKNRTPVYHDNGQFFVVRTTNVRRMKLTLEKALFTDEKNFIEWTKRGIPKVGSILLTREAPAGEACLVPEKLPLCLGQRMMSVIPDKSVLIPKFLLYLIYSNPIRTYIAICSSGSTVTHLRVPQIYEIPILSPSVAEQTAIVHHIETQCNRIDAIINKLKKQINLFKEYRTALISEAVTGKIQIK